jgi:hypothetical protein
MTLAKARRVLAMNGVYWSNSFDLDFILHNRHDNWVGCEEIQTAILRVKTFLSTGR